MTGQPTNEQQARQLMAGTPEILARLLREAVELERMAQALHEYATRVKDSATTAATLSRGILSLLGEDEPGIWTRKLD